MEEIRLNNIVYRLIKPIFLALYFLSLFKGVFNSLFRTSLFEYLDEFLFLIGIIILLPIFLLNSKLKIVFFLISVFIFYSIIVSLIFGVNKNIFILTFQTFITIKFIIILLALLELFKNDFGKLNRVFKYIIVFALTGLLIHLFFGVKLNQWIGISAFARPNIRYLGFFTHPNHLAYLMVVYVAYLLNNKFVNRLKLSLADWLKILIGFFVIILADSRTAMLGAGILIFAFYWELIKKNYKIIFSFLVLGFFGFLYVYFYTSLKDSIIQNINDTLDITSSYIRGNMIYLSGLIFIDYFPFGTGAATFGSVLSDDTVYAIYGQADRYYFANEIGIYDSNVASVIGEYGFIGMLLFGTIFFYLIRYLKQITPYRTLIMPLMVVFLLYSITNPMLTNNVYSLLSAIVLFLFVKVTPQSNLLKESR